MKKRLICFLMVLAINFVCFPLASFAAESIKSEYSIVKSYDNILENKDKVVDSNTEVNELALENVNENNYSVSSEADSLYSIKNKKGLYKAAFKSKAGKELLSFSQGNANLIISPLNFRSVSGSVYNNTITYENIYPDTSIKYTLERSWLKEDIIVRKYTGMSDFYFQLNVNNAEYEKKANEEIYFFDPGSDKPLFYIPKPYALDKNGDRCDLVNMELSKEGLLTLSVDPEWMKTAVYPVIIDPTFILLNATFTRSTVAYKQDGTQVSVNNPRFENGKFGQALMVEEGAINILTSNQSSAETDLTGWRADGYSGALISKVIGGWHGSCSVQCNLNEGDSWVGFAELPFTKGSTYTFSIYAKGTPGKQISLRYYDGTTEGGSATFTLTDSWQRYKYTFTISNSATTLYTFVRGIPNNAQTLYIDGCQLEQRAYATSWMTGGSTRGTETLTIPTAGIISANKGSIEVSAYIDPVGVHSVNNANWSMVFAMVDVQNSPYQEKNHISIRRSPNTTNWGIWFSNASGECSIVDLGSITTAGWYTFGITWDADTGGYGYLNGVNKGSVATRFLPTTITAPVAYIGSWTSGNQYNQLIDDLRISNRARTAAEIQGAFQSNQPLPVDADTTCKMYLDGDIQITKYSYNSSEKVFTRSTVAYKQDGTQVSVNNPRFENGKFGQALMVEEGAINILTSNQSSAETDLTGWRADGYSGALISKVIGGWHGSYSVQCNFNEGDSWVGFAELPFTKGSTYTFSIYAKGTPGKQISLHYYDGTTEGGSAAFTLTDSWQRYKYTFTISNSATTLYTFVRGIPNNAQTLYIDGCQLEQRAYATSWMTGGSTRGTETLTIPTAGIISANKGSIEVSAYIDPVGVHSVNNANWSMVFAMVDVQNSPYQEKNHISIRRSPNTTNWGIWFSNASGEGSIVNLGSITTAGWYTFGITWDANTGGQGYLNGVNKGSVATRFLPTTISAPVAYIGSWTSGNQYNQLIDDLRISNRARTAAEIQGAFQSNQPLPVDADTTLKVTFDNSLDANIPAINYIYDSLNRLNMVVTPNKAINLQYDNNGNLIRRTINYQGN